METTTIVGSQGNNTTTTTTTTTGTTSKNQLKIDKIQFYRRLKILYESWGNTENEAYWKSANSLVLPLGSPDEDNPYQKTVSIQSWLFGYEMKETIVVFLKNEIHIYTTSSKEKLFEGLEKYEGTDYKALNNIKIVYRSRDGNKATENKTNFDILIGVIEKEGVNVGLLMKEKMFGDYGKQWDDCLNSQSQLTKVDVTVGFSSLLWIKDQNEQKNMKASAVISDKVLKNLMKKIEEVIDTEESETHSELAEYALEIYKTPEKLSSKLTSDTVDFAYTPIIQSGGQYDLKLSANSNDDKLHFGTIIVSLGSRYKEYCSNIARTLFIDPTDEQVQNYELLLKVQAVVLKNLKAGSKISQAFDKAVELINQTKPDLLKYFLKNCGYGIGIEFQEAQLVVNSTNQKLVKSGMTFNLVIGFLNIPNPKAKTEQSKVYSMLLSDVALITDTDGNASLLTSENGKKKEDVVYFLGDDAVNDPSLKLDLPKEMQPISTKRENKDKLKEEKLRDHQKMLAEKNRIDVENKIKDIEGKKGPKIIVPEIDYTSLTQKLSSLYPSVSNYPPEVLKNKIHIDFKKESILLPIYGYVVPFHISTIKNVSKYEEYLRINFNSPSSFSQEQIDAGLVPNLLMYIREVTFRISNPSALTNHQKLIKELRKQVTTRESEDREKRTLIAQERLIMNRIKPPKITDVNIRPTLAGSRRTIGTLEAHENGLRFSPSTGKERNPIDILYKNVKHSIFQPADKELMAIIHFHLHNDLMIGKKKTKDIQFYTEISDVTQSLDVSGRGFRDEDDDEQKDRELRRKVNAEFKEFIKKLEAQVPSFKVELPFRELGFFGVPNTGNVFVQPSLHTLFSVFEVPFFVLSLDEVEIACFERVIRSLRNFELVFIFKDYNRAPVRIDAIPREYFENIKEWLDSADIKFYQNEKNFQWKRVLDTIKADIKKFHEDGGWAFLEPSTGSDGEGEDDEDDDYNSGEESDYSSDYISSMSSDSESEEESDSEGEEWEDLASKADNEDKKKTVGKSSSSVKSTSSSSKPSSSSSSKPSSSSSSKPSSSSKSSSSSSSKPSSSSSSKSSSSKPSSSSKSSSSSPSSKKSSSSSSSDNKRKRDEIAKPKKSSSSSSSKSTSSSKSSSSSSKSK